MVLSKWPIEQYIFGKIIFRQQKKWPENPLLYIHSVSAGALICSNINLGKFIQTKKNLPVYHRFEYPQHNFQKQLVHRPLEIDLY